MKLSPLQLEHSLLDEISLVPEKHTKEFNGELNIQARPSFARHAEDPQKWQVSLAVQVSGSGEKPAPYALKISMLGWFRVAAGDLDEHKQLEIIAVNAPTILYSAAREIVAGLTARSVNGIFLLPSVSFAGTRVMPSTKPLIQEDQQGPAKGSRKRSKKDS